MAHGRPRLAQQHDSPPRLPRRRLHGGGREYGHVLAGACKAECAQLRPACAVTSVPAQIVRNEALATRLPPPTTCLQHGNELAALAHCPGAAARHQQAARRHQPHSLHRVGQPIGQLSIPCWRLGRRTALGHTNVTRTAQKSHTNSCCLSPRHLCIQTPVAMRGAGQRLAVGRQLGRVEHDNVPLPPLPHRLQAATSGRQQAWPDALMCAQAGAPPSPPHFPHTFKRWPRTAPSGPSPLF